MRSGSRKTANPAAGSKSSIELYDGIDEDEEDRHEDKHVVETASAKKDIKRGKSLSKRHPYFLNSDEEESEEEEEYDDAAHVKMAAESRDDADDRPCPICLQPFEDRSVLISCFHDFCHFCITKWAAVSRSCPLCKKAFKECLHDFKSDRDYIRFTFPVVPTEKGKDRLVIQPQRVLPELSALPDHSAASRTGEQILADAKDQIKRESAEARRKRIWVDGKHTMKDFKELSSLDKRRHVFFSYVLIYKEKLEPLNPPVSSNNLTPESFSKDKALQERVRPWISRDLQVLLKDSDVDIVKELVISVMERFHLDSKEAVDELRPFVMRSTERFLKELATFAMSTLSIKQWDKVVKYRDPTRPLSSAAVASSENGPGLSNGSQESLKASEPTSLRVDLSEKCQSCGVHVSTPEKSGSMNPEDEKDWGEGSGDCTQASVSESRRTSDTSSRHRRKRSLSISSAGDQSASEREASSYLNERSREDRKRRKHRHHHRRSWSRINHSHSHSHSHDEDSKRHRRRYRGDGKSRSRRNWDDDPSDSSLSSSSSGSSDDEKERRRRKHRHRKDSTKSAKRSREDSDGEERHSRRRKDESRHKDDSRNHSRDIGSRNKSDKNGHSKEDHCSSRRNRESPRSRGMSMDLFPQSIPPTPTSGNDPSEETAPSLDRGDSQLQMKSRNKNRRHQSHKSYRGRLDPKDRKDPRLEVSAAETPEEAAARLREILLKTKKINEAKSLKASEPEIEKFYNSVEKTKHKVDKEMDLAPKSQEKGLVSAEKMALLRRKLDMLLTDGPKEVARDGSNKSASELRRKLLERRSASPSVGKLSIDPKSAETVEGRELSSIAWKLTQKLAKLGVKPQPGRSTSEDGTETDAYEVTDLAVAREGKEIYPGEEREILKPSTAANNADTFAIPFDFLPEEEEIEILPWKRSAGGGYAVSSSQLKINVIEPRSSFIPSIHSPILPHKPLMVMMMTMMMRILSSSSFGFATLLLFNHISVATSQTVKTSDVAALCNAATGTGALSISSTQWGLGSSGSSSQRNVSLSITALSNVAISTSFASVLVPNFQDSTYNFCDLVNCPLEIGANITFKLPLHFTENNVRTAEAKTVQLILWRLDAGSTLVSQGCWSFDLTLPPAIPPPDSQITKVSIVALTLTCFALTVTLVSSMLWHWVLRDTETTHFEFTRSGAVSLSLSAADESVPLTRMSFPTFTDLLMHCQFIAIIGMLAMKYPRAHFDFLKTFAWAALLFGGAGVDRVASLIRDLGGKNRPGDSTSSSSTITSTAATIPLETETESLSTTQTQGAAPTGTANLPSCSPENSGGKGVCSIIGYCCSVSGYCGTGPEYCSNGGGPPFNGQFLSFDMWRVIPRADEQSTPTTPTEVALPSVTGTIVPSAPIGTQASPTISPWAVYPSSDIKPSEVAAGIERYVEGSTSLLSSGENAFGSAIFITACLACIAVFIFAIAIPVGSAVIYGLVGWRWKNQPARPVSSQSMISVGTVGNSGFITSGGSGMVLSSTSSTPIPGQLNRPISSAGEVDVDRSASAFGLLARVEGPSGDDSSFVKKAKAQEIRTRSSRWRRWLWLHGCGIVFQIFNFAFLPLLVFSMHRLSLANGGDPNGTIVKWQPILLAVVVILLVFASLFVVVLRIVRVVPHERLFSEKSYLIKFGSIYGSYKPSHLFFFILSFAYRSVFALIVGGLLASSTLQASLLVIMEALYLTFLLIFSPHARPISNILAVVLAASRCLTVSLLFPYIVAQLNEEKERRSDGTPFSARGFGDDTKEEFSVLYASWCSVGLQSIVMFGFFVAGCFNLWSAIVTLRVTSEKKKRDSTISLASLGSGRVNDGRSSRASFGPNAMVETDMNARSSRVMSVTSLSAMSGSSIPLPISSKNESAWKASRLSSSQVSLPIFGNVAGGTPVLHSSQSNASLSSTYYESPAVSRNGSNIAFGSAAPSASDSISGSGMVYAPPTNSAPAGIRTAPQPTPTPPPPPPIQAVPFLIAGSRSSGAFSSSNSIGSSVQVGNMVSNALNMNSSPTAATPTISLPGEKGLEKIKTGSESTSASAGILGIFKRVIEGRRSSKSSSTQSNVVAAPAVVDYDVEGLDTYLKKEAALMPTTSILGWTKSSIEIGRRTRDDAAREEDAKLDYASQDGVSDRNQPTSSPASNSPLSPSVSIPYRPPSQTIPPLASVLMVSHLPPGQASSSKASSSHHRMSVSSFMPADIARPRPYSMAGSGVSLPLSGQNPYPPPPPGPGLWLAKEAVSTAVVETIHGEPMLVEESEGKRPLSLPILESQINTRPVSSSTAQALPAVSEENTEKTRLSAPVAPVRVSSFERGMLDALKHISASSISSGVSADLSAPALTATSPLAVSDSSSHQTDTNLKAPSGPINRFSRELQPRAATRPSSYQSGTQVELMEANAALMTERREEQGNGVDADSLFSTLPSKWGTFTSSSGTGGTEGTLSTQGATIKAGARGLGALRTLSKSSIGSGGKDLKDPMVTADERGGVHVNEGVMASVDRVEMVEGDYISIAPETEREIATPEADPDVVADQTTPVLTAAAVTNLRESAIPDSPGRSSVASFTSDKGLPPIPLAQEDTEDKKKSRSSKKRDVSPPKVLKLVNPDPIFVKPAKTRMAIEESSDEEESGKERKRDDLVDSDEEADDDAPAPQNEVDSSMGDYDDDDESVRHPTLTVSFASWARRGHTLLKSANPSTPNAALNHFTSLSSIRSSSDAPVPIGGFRGGSPVVVNPDVETDGVEAASPAAEPGSEASERGKRGKGRWRRSGRWSGTFGASDGKGLTRFWTVGSTSSATSESGSSS
ncbi:hypothetical protein HDU97_008861 [Phlyctochytrium planicorne]|nr:hypothetical protein HDU97_008861 [Phlyctochytrium planicorne]